MNTTNVKPRGRPKKGLVTSIQITNGGTGYAIAPGMGMQNPTPAKEPEDSRSAVLKQICEDYEDTGRTFPEGMQFKFYNVFGWTLKKDSVYRQLVDDLRKHPTFWRMYRDKRSTLDRQIVLYNQRLDIAVIQRDDCMLHEVAYERIGSSSGERLVILSQIFDHIHDVFRREEEARKKAIESKEDVKKNEAQHKLRQKLNDIGYI